MSFLPSTAASNAAELKGMPLSEGFFIDHSNAKVTVAKQPSGLNFA